MQPFLCPVRGRLWRQFVIIAANYLRKWYLPLWAKRWRFKISAPGLIAVITALHIKMSPWPRWWNEDLSPRPQPSTPPPPTPHPMRSNLKVWFPVSGEDSKWLFKSKLTTRHIAYSVQVKSSFHHSVIARPVRVCNPNQWKNNALRPPPTLPPPLPSTV